MNGCREQIYDWQRMQTWLRPMAVYCWIEQWRDWIEETKGSQGAERREQLVQSERTFRLAIITDRGGSDLRQLVPYLLAVRSRRRASTAVYNSTDDIDIYTRHQWHIPTTTLTRRNRVTMDEPAAPKFPIVSSSSFWASKDVWYSSVTTLEYHPVLVDAKYVRFMGETTGTQC